jgi:hypothetical protein
MAPAANALEAARTDAFSRLRDDLGRALTKAPPRSLFRDAHLGELEHAVALMEDGDKQGAARVLFAFGVDLMGERVEAMMASLVGKSEAECLRDASTRSIFTGMGGACALRILVESAYQPVADYFGNQGQPQADASHLAATVYKDLLATAYLDNTPVILNVGLGANYIRGHEDVWGPHGMVALTVVDKLGLAFYKRSWQSFRFEMGPFVGGFLDALVRTLDKDKSERSWLLGYTVGMPRMWGSDVGVELHAAAALPFELNQTHRNGFALGAALVIPFNSVLEGDAP